ncbi:MAG: type II toxin-antitoxin system RelE/ParE family toxin [Nitrospinae bacterium]|nr:type II toxin-antitoxin system RelE/ParE family toxin [Nitrospinota bacterium]MBF0634256.1 type II toxin-antitoxin system RelE/ParE family toxin [Nitrospinota bacterium]
MKRIEVTNRAKRQIDKIGDRKIITDIYEAMEQLEKWPDVRGVKSLVNRNDYRLRVDRYRVFFFVENETIVITEVKIRNEKTY